MASSADRGARGAAGIAGWRRRRWHRQKQAWWRQRRDEAEAEQLERVKVGDDKRVGCISGSGRGERGRCDGAGLVARGLGRLSGLDRARLVGQVAYGGLVRERAGLSRSTLSRPGAAVRFGLGWVGDRVWVGLGARVSAQGRLGV